MDENEHDQPDEELTEAQQQLRHRMRMRFEWRDLIEDMIQDGQERGLFDNLSGKGKPLNLQRDPFAGDSELANSLLRAHDMVPTWLLHRNLIGQEIEVLRNDIARRWARYKQAYALAQDDGHRHALSLGWENNCHMWEEEIVLLNKGIADYNFERPTDHLELYKLRLDDELKRAGAPRTLE